MSIEIANESGAPVDEHALVLLSRHVLDHLGIHPQAELSILLVGVDAMSALHEQWMGESGPTDVLSFPMDELRPPGDDGEAEPGQLGDVVLCPAVAATQAVDHRRTFEQEIDLLCTHGILHLLGFDHAEPDEHREMFGLQDAILATWRRPAPGSVPPPVRHPQLEAAPSAGPSGARSAEDAAAATSPQDDEDPS